LLFAFFLTCCVELGIATVLLVLLGGRVRSSNPLLAVVLFGVTIFAAGQVAADVWTLPGRPVRGAEVFVAVIGVLVIATRRAWNQIGQLFFACFLSASSAYLLFAGRVTVAGSLTLPGRVASAALLLLECSALLLASSFAFETCDVVCRVRHTRPEPAFDPSYRPFVSLHIPAYNEPPDMLIKTVQSAERLDYENFEVIVVDNNTTDPEVWRPVEDYCRGREHVKFVHVEDLEGYKSGALNLALREHTDPRTEIVGVIDADYLVEPGYVRESVGFFSDPNVAFVQSPQDYRDWEGSDYFTACYDAYRYFFATSMPSRNERNSIIFAGTMGLLRKPLLESVGGWDEWCITEDAETSLRLLMAGYSSQFIGRSFGKGIMPLTFAALKKQRFRWCFGGMQILRRHWRDLVPGRRTRANQLTTGQRLDYLFGGLQWMNDLVLFGFALVLLAVSGVLLSGSSVPIRPLVGPTILLPGTLLATGLIRAVWALRRQTRITLRRALLAFVSWLSLSLTVARACLQGLTRREGVFLRTPKLDESQSLAAALKAAIPETLMGLVLWGSAFALAARAHPTPLLLGLIAWQGAVYMSSLWISWLSQRARLTPELRRRRSSEDLRDRRARRAVLGSAGAAIAGAAFVLVVGFGSSNAGHPGNPFAIPHRSPHDNGPWGGLISPGKQKAPSSPSPTTTVPAGPSSTTVTPTTTTPPTTTSPTTTPPSTTAPAATPTT
jgi:cellulose synthase/poly-beta-1,6-N-acetylglucosamine synthase-like glycosyltransferase